MAEATEPHSERISEAEHAVMEALWEKSPLTAADVCEAVCEQRGWSMPTVKTLLSRLVAKGAVATAPDGRRFLYTPLLERADYVGGESRRLVDRHDPGYDAAEDRALSAAADSNLQHPATGTPDHFP